MVPSVNPGRSVKALAVPLLLSLALHGSLFLALWLWPTHTRPPALAIESTRIALDTCRLDLESSAQKSGAKPSSLPHGPNQNVDFTPRLQEAAPLPRDDTGSPRSMPFLINSIPPAPGTHAGSNSASGGNGAASGMFALPPAASSVVYVLDRSVSMGVHNKLDLACRELLASLRRLPSSTRFQVIAYNTSAQPLAIAGRIDLLPVEPAILAEAASTLHQLAAAGGTDHVQALRRGLALHPDVLFFVTDADDLPMAQIDLVTRCNRGTTIHTIELSRRRTPRPDGPLAQLARGNGGTYRHIAAGWSKE